MFVRQIHSYISQFVCPTMSYIVRAHAHRHTVTVFFTAPPGTLGGGRGEGSTIDALSFRFVGRLTLWVHPDDSMQAALGGLIRCGPFGADGAVQCSGWRLGDFAGCASL